MSEKSMDEIWKYEKTGKKTACITGYNGDETDVIVPKKFNELKVESIGEYAFKDKNITSIIMPDTLTDIYDLVFEGCKNLSHVEFTYQYTFEYIRIYPDAFKNCDKLVDQNGFLIVNNQLIEYLGDEVNVVIPEGVVTISGRTFSNKKKLVSVIFPDSLHSIGGSAFVDCPELSVIKTRNANVHVCTAFVNCPKLLDKDGYITIGNPTVNPTDDY